MTAETRLHNTLDVIIDLLRENNRLLQKQNVLLEKLSQPPVIITYPESTFTKEDTAEFNKNLKEGGDYHRIELLT